VIRIALCGADGYVQMEIECKWVAEWVEKAPKGAADHPFFSGFRALS